MMTLLSVVVQRIKNTFYSAPVPPPPPKPPRSIFYTLSADSSTSSLPTDSELPHTARLLSALLKGLTDPDANIVCRHYDVVFQRVLLHIRGVPCDQMEGFLSARFRQFIMRSDVRICITEHIEQARTEGLIWGHTNWKKDRTEELGFLIPALNWALCAEYEETFSDDEPNSMLLRGQLGCLVVVTFLHELAHSWIRQLLQNTVPLNWSTPDISGNPGGKSGDEIEGSLFHGKIIAIWHKNDITKIERFKLIRGVWVQPTMGTIPTGPLYRIGPERLLGFYQSVLGSKINVEIIQAFFSDDNLERKTKQQLEKDDRLLLRWTAGPAGALSADGIDLLKYPPFCLLGLERAAQRNPEIMKKYFGGGQG